MPSARSRRLTSGHSAGPLGAVEHGDRSELEVRQQVHASVDDVGESRLSAVRDAVDRSAVLRHLRTVGPGDGRFAAQGAADRRRKPTATRVAGPKGALLGSAVGRRPPAGTVSTGQLTRWRRPEAVAPWNRSCSRPWPCEPVISRSAPDSLTSRASSLVGVAVAEARLGLERRARAGRRRSPRAWRDPRGSPGPRSRARGSVRRRSRPRGAGRARRPGSSARAAHVLEHRRVGGAQLERHRDACVAVPRSPRPRRPSRRRPAARSGGRARRRGAPASRRAPSEPGAIARAGGGATMR